MRSGPQQRRQPTRRSPEHCRPSYDNLSTKYILLASLFLITCMIHRGVPLVFTVDLVTQRLFLSSLLVSLLLYISKKTIILCSSLFLFLPREFVSSCFLVLSFSSSQLHNFTSCSLVVCPILKTAHLPVVRTARERADTRLPALWREE